MTKLLAPLILLAGCAIEPDIDNHLGPRFDIYDDGTQVRVVGCADAAFLGCNEPLPGEVMTVTAGGETITTMRTLEPESTLDQVLGNLFMGGDFVIDVATPADGIVEVELGGSKARRTLPAAFAIDAPATFVRSRPLVIQYEPLFGASETIAFVSTTCSTSGALDALEETAPGRLELDLSPRGSGSCTHEVHVDQVVDSAPTRVVKIGVVNLTSEP